MNPEYEPYELIDRYLNKTMNQEEVSRFEERCTTDENLQELMEAQKIANEYLIDLELLKLKNRMQVEMNDHGSNLWSKVLIGCSAALMAGGALYLLFNSDSVPAKQPELTRINSEIVVQEKNPAPENKIVNAMVNRTTKITPLPTNNTFPDKEKENTVSINESKQVQENLIIPIKEEHETKTTSTPVLVKENTTINCDQIKIEADARVNYSFSEEEPKIVVNAKSIRGGSAPYSFSLDKKSYISETTFEELKDGTYRIYIKDKHNCISELDNTLIVKRPVKEIDQSFSPANGSRWNFPLNNQTDGTITIFNKVGMAVYTANITGGYPNDWDGKDINGRELDSGNYSFIINFANNEFVKGHITIFK